MSKWVAVKKKPRNRTPAKAKVTPPARLVWITDDDWNNRFDPIDKEVYYLFKEHYPEMLSVPRILSLLKELDEEENADYSVQDVCDSLELCLRGYLIADLGEGTYQLKLKV